MAEAEKKKLFERMILIRVAQERIAQIYPSGKIRCPVHLCTGQEAAPAGVCSVLDRGDWIFCGHRNHGWYIAKGGDMGALFAELFGRKNGCCRGKGGSMHLAAPEVGMSLTSSVVAGTLPHAVGAALNFRMKKEGAIAVAACGDGAVEEGVFFESLNFARLFSLPVLFCVENNGLSVESPVEKRRAFDLAKVCDAFGIACHLADGSDVVEVAAQARTAAAAAREGRPSLLEITVHRFRDHVHPPAWSDHLSEEQRAALDPIAGCGGAPWVEEAYASARRCVEKALAFAEGGPFPNKEDLLTDVVN